MQRLHFDHRLRTALAPVIAGEFAERPFLLGDAGMQHALDHELGMRGDRQADAFRVGQFNRPSHHAAGDIELGILEAEYLRAEHEQHRIDAVRRHHFAGFSARPPGVAVEQRVLAGRAVEPDAPRSVQHLPVAADIDAAGVGLCGERDVGGADIAAAVARPEFRHREFCEVDLTIAQHDLIDRRGVLGNAVRRNAPPHELAALRDHVGDRQIGIEAGGQRIAFFAGAEQVDEHARAGIVPLQIVEQERRGTFATRRHVCDRRQFLVRIDGRFDALEQAIGIHQAQPFAQVAPGDGGGSLGVVRDDRTLMNLIFHRITGCSQRATLIVRCVAR